MGLEHVIEKDAVAYLAARGGKMIKLVSPGYTGVPDRACSHPRTRPWLMELKHPTKTARRRQEIVAQELADAGWRVYLDVDTIKKAREIIDDEIAGATPRHEYVRANDGFGP